MTTTYRSIVLDGDDLIPDGADSTAIRGGWSVTTAGDRVTFRTCDGRDYGIDAETARSFGAALVQHSVRAEHAAEIADLVRVIEATGMGRPRLAAPQEAARAVWAAGYRKETGDAASE